MKLTTLADRWQICSQPRRSFRPPSFSFSPSAPVAPPGSTAFPFSSNPRISMPTLLVRPLSTSCLCLKRLTRALPRPSSSPPRVRTPSVVDLPASTLPRTAMRSSGRWAREGGARRRRAEKEGGEATVRRGTTWYRGRKAAARQRGGGVAGSRDAREEGQARTVPPSSAIASSNLRLTSSVPTPSGNSSPSHSCSSLSSSSAPA